MPYIKRQTARKCSMKDCTSNHKTRSIYNFPKNEKLRKKWVKIISYSNPEFADIEDIEILKLGVCEDHFMFYKFDDCGKKKRKAYPNKITQHEVFAGLPITSIDSDSDSEWEKSKKIKTSTAACIKKDFKDTEEDICRLCLATDVKMFSLKTEPVKQYYQFIEPCIDELEVLSNNNFPTTVCYLCVNALKKCYEFGQMCSQSQSVLMEFQLIYSKIKTKDIKDYDKSHLQHRYNLNKFSLPNIYIKESKENQDPIKIDSNHTDEPLILKKVDAKEIFLNMANKGFNVQKEVPFQIFVDGNKKSVPAPFPSQFGIPAYTDEVVIEEDRMSVEYLDQEILENNEFDLGVESLEDINLPTKASVVPEEVTMDESTLLTYGHSDLSVFGSLSFDETLQLEPVPRLDIRRTKDKITLSAAETEKIDILPASELKGEAFIQSTPLPEKCSDIPSTSFESPSASKTAKEDGVFVDVENVVKDPPKDTPIISQSQIDILKKSVYNSHGDVEIKRIFYQGNDIHVVMVNAEGKQVQLMLSRTESLKTAKRKPKQPQADVVFNRHCWDIRLLSKESQWILIQNRKRSPNYLKSPFRCKICFRWFQFPTSYNAHMELHNPKSGSHGCQVCKLHFDDDPTLQKHLRTHTKQYSCKMCPAVFYTITTAKEHQSTHKVFVCPVCDQQFRFISDYNKHAILHGNETDCNSSIGFSNPLIKYETDRKKQCTLPKKWTAICCGITFVHKTTYKRHFAVNHPEQNYPLSEEGVICELCGALVHTQKTLLIHLEGHYNPKKSFKCKYCDKAFGNKRWLRRHVLRHTNTKLFKCQICAKSYKKKSSLKEHFLKCTNNREERPYVCDMCGRRFFKNCTLQAHVLAVHMGIKQNKQKEFKKNRIASLIELED